CKTHPHFAVIDPHAGLGGEHVALSEAQGAPIVAVPETHVQAGHVSGLPELVARTGATACLPAVAGVEFEHHPLADGEGVKLGNVEIRALATSGHALARHAYLVTGHTVEQMAATLYRSLTDKLLTLPGYLVLYPSHYSGPVCGRGLSAGAASTIGAGRRHNPALLLLLHTGQEFAAALTRDMSPAPGQQAAIVAANRCGRPLAEAA
ncbi:MAG: hypothetical protein ACRDOE_12875, partial [Streptosporangiaceae bacterium]